MNLLEISNWFDNRMLSYQQGWGMPALIWLATLLIFVMFFFRAYFMNKPFHLEKQSYARRRSRKLKTTQLVLPDHLGRMDRRDWLIASALTLAYGLFAFSFAGNTAAPQTFWRATKEQPSLTVDLGEAVSLQNFFYYPGFGDGQWILELSVDGQEWEKQNFMGHLRWNMFSWAIRYFKPKQQKLLAISVFQRMP